MCGFRFILVMGVISWVLQLHSGCSLQPIDDNICSKKKNTVNLLTVPAPFQPTIL